MKKQNQAENEPSDADPLPHRLIDPNQYNNSLPQPEQAHATSETLTILGQVPPVCTYGSISHCHLTQGQSTSVGSICGRSTLKFGCSS